MQKKFCTAITLLLLLTGCGTLEINVEYGWTPARSESTPAPTATSTPAEERHTPASTGQPAATASQTQLPTTAVPGVPRAIAVASGEAHTCVATDLGGVNCWGNNEHGQLGNGTMVNSSVPAEVKGLEDVTAVASGWAHSCALTRTGGVKCWGYNKNGELGNGDTTDSSVPVEVNGLTSGVKAIKTGDDHTCAVTEWGGVKCWGLNEYGQLGDGTTTSRSVPVEVQGLTGSVMAAAAGWGHTCILTTGGGAKCWGNNEYGQLGYGQEAEYRYSAVDVLELGSGVIGIGAGGGLTCVLTVGGGAKCWGNNKYGQLGDGTGEKRSSPVAVDGLSQGVGKVSVGRNHTCAVMGNGELKCWGWNYYGQLGDGTRATQSRPVNTKRIMEDVTDVGPGWAHTCAVTAGGGVKCWGSNHSGQLGDGTTLDSIVPLSIVGLRSSYIPR